MTITPISASSCGAWSAPRKTSSIASSGNPVGKGLEDGFPAKPDELFQFQGLIIGSVEANYFTPTQQQLIHDFVDRRGGGVLFLGGRASLSDGGYPKSPLADLMPTTCLRARARSIATSPVWN